MIVRESGEMYVWPPCTDVDGFIGTLISGYFAAPWKLKDDGAERLLQPTRGLYCWMCSLWLKNY